MSKTKQSCFSRGTHRKPKLGDAWSDFCGVWAGLAERRLTPADYDWLDQLFKLISEGADVRELFLTKVGEAKAPSDWTFWIALDVACNRRGRDPDQADELTARRWSLKASTVQQYATEHNADMQSVKHLLKNPAFAKVIDWHRVRLLKKRKM